MTDNMDEAAPSGGRSFKLIRERGTLRLVVGAVALCVLWYGYASLRTYQMQQVKWPKAQADAAGLTVVGLQDVNKPGRQRRYVAIESNHAWQIRRPDDAAEEETGEVEEEAGDYRPTAAVARRTAAGDLVSVEEVLRVCPVVLNGKHFGGADMEESYEPFRDKPYWKVHLRLTDEGRSRYWQFSRDHDGERLVFVLAGEILTCPRMSHMDTATLTIEPIWVKEDAERLVQAMRGTK
jgi:preprotein translocase subunit SecD